MIESDRLFHHAARQPARHEEWNAIVR